MLAEYYDQQRILDYRTYKMMSVHFGIEHPSAHELFPLLKDLPKEDDDKDDEMKFKSITAQFSLGL